jgi:hypothetical protein
VTRSLKWLWVAQLSSPTPRGRGPEETDVTQLLEHLLQIYVQDFDVTFEKNTDPVDLFCQQHSLTTK